MIKPRDYLDLFWTFFKIGLFTFGGGYAMLGVMHTTIVDKKKWINDHEMTNLISVAECTPGPFAINAATFIGYKRGKFLGSFLATLGVVIPSVIIILLVSISLNYFKENIFIQKFLKGIQAGVAFLVLKAFHRLSSKVSKTIFNIIVFFFTFILVLFFNFNIIYIFLILGAFAISLLFLQREDLIYR